MKVTAVLCDYAVVADGKLYISGGGWNITGPDPSPSAVALLFEVPWDRTNTKIRFTVELLTTDEQPVMQPGPLGAQRPVKAEGGRPSRWDQGGF
jgi:hypothetical protein